MEQLYSRERHYSMLKQKTCIRFMEQLFSSSTLGRRRPVREVSAALLPGTKPDRNPLAQDQVRVVAVGRLSRVQENDRSSV